MINIPQGCEILGLVGNAATGKDYIASKLAEKGFVSVSASDVLRESIRNQGLEVTRANQTAIANEIRKNHGSDYLVNEALRRALLLYHYSKDRGVLISGIYAPAEGKALKKFDSARIIEIVQSTADDPSERFKRLRARRDGSRDLLTYEEFHEAFQRENSGVGDDEANVRELALLADYTFINDNNAQSLKKQLDFILGDSV